MLRTDPRAEELRRRIERYRATRHSGRTVYVVEVPKPKMW